MKKYFFLAAIALMPLFSAAQVYKTSAGKISFVSKTAKELSLVYSGNGLGLNFKF